MRFQIDWSEATVSNGVLSVPVVRPPDDLADQVSSRDWGLIFSRVVSQPIPGVQYTLSHVWGPIRLSDGLIVAEKVIDPVVNEVRLTLEAAVAKANDEFVVHRAKHEHEWAQQREQREQRAQQDRALTDRFRNPQS